MWSHVLFHSLCGVCVSRACLRAQFVGVLVAHLCPHAGQHFLAHEDGFPASAALEKGYNRRHTLLVYLNDVPEVRCEARGWQHISASSGPMAGCQHGRWLCKVCLLRRHPSLTVLPRSQDTVVLRGVICFVSPFLHVQGGATKFNHLDLEVQPQRGKALLFFPAFSGGKSDARWA